MHFDHENSRLLTHTRSPLRFFTLPETCKTLRKENAGLKAALGLTSDEVSSSSEETKSIKGKEREMEVDAVDSRASFSSNASTTISAAGGAGSSGSSSARPLHPAATTGFDFSFSGSLGLENLNRADPQQVDAAVVELERKIAVLQHHISVLRGGPQNRLVGARSSVPIMSHHSVPPSTFVPNPSGMAAASPGAASTAPGLYHVPSSPAPVNLIGVYGVPQPGLHSLTGQPNVLSNSNNTSPSSTNPGFYSMSTPEGSGGHRRIYSQSSIPSPHSMMRPPGGMHPYPDSGIAHAYPYPVQGLQQQEQQNHHQPLPIPSQRQQQQQPLSIPPQQHHQHHRVHSMDESRSLYHGAQQPHGLQEQVHAKHESNNSSASSPRASDHASSSRGTTTSPDVLHLDTRRMNAPTQPRVKVEQQQPSPVVGSTGFNSENDVSSGTGAEEAECDVLPIKCAARSGGPCCKRGDPGVWALVPLDRLSQDHETAAAAQQHQIMLRQTQPAPSASIHAHGQQQQQQQQQGGGGYSLQQQQQPANQSGTSATNEPVQQRTASNTDKCCLGILDCNEQGDVTALASRYAQEQQQETAQGPLFATAAPNVARSGCGPAASALATNQPALPNDPTSSECCLGLFKCNERGEIMMD